MEIYSKLSVIQMNYSSTAKVTDIDIVDKLTSDNLKPSLVGAQSSSSYDNSTEAIGPKML